LTSSLQDLHKSAAFCGPITPSMMYVQVLGQFIKTSWLLWVRRASPTRVQFGLSCGCRQGWMSLLKILMTASEVTPLAKAGGLADVTAALGAYLHRAGHDIRILMPYYSTTQATRIDVRPVEELTSLSVDIGPQRVEFSISLAVMPDSGLRVYLLRCPEFYDRDGIYTDDADEHARFILLSRAAIEMSQHLTWAPDIFHCNDWHTALIPLYLRTLYHWDELFARSRSVLTIHNIGHQGIVGTTALADMGLEDSAHLFHQEDFVRGQINFLKTGVQYADILTTVSPTYAREIQTEEYGMGLEDLLRARSDSLTGILNGVDYSEWNPAHDSLIPYPYNARNLVGKENNKKALMKSVGLKYEQGTPLVGMVARLGWQKGVTLMQEVLPGLLRGRGFSFAILGSGEAKYEAFFSALQQEFPRQVYFHRGFSHRLAHWIEAGSDMFLMPSAYEPCGLNQMYSLKYGTIPIVRKTGGLADSVEPYDPDTGKGTGIVFEAFDAESLVTAVEAALELYQDTAAWLGLMGNAMAADFSWESMGPKYVDVYRAVREAPTES